MWTFSNSCKHSVNMLVFLLVIKYHLSSQQKGWKEGRQINQITDLLFNASSDQICSVLDQSPWQIWAVLYHSSQDRSPEFNSPFLTAGIVPEESALSLMPPVAWSAQQFVDTWTELHRGAQKMKCHSVPQDSETPKWPEILALFFISHESQQTSCPNLFLEVVETYKIAIYNGISSSKRKKKNSKNNTTKEPTTHNFSSFPAHVSSSHVSFQACSVTPVLSATFQESNAIGFHKKGHLQKTHQKHPGWKNKPTEVLSIKKSSTSRPGRKNSLAFGSTWIHLLKPIKYCLIVLEILSLSKMLLSTVTAWMGLYKSILKQHFVLT